MKFNQRTYGLSNATLYIYRFNLEDDDVKPELLCDGTSKMKLTAFVNSIPASKEPVLGVNGGLFNLITLTDNKPHGDTYILNLQKNDSSTTNTGDEIMDVFYRESEGLLIQRSYPSDVTDTSIKWLRSGAYNLIDGYSKDVFDYIRDNVEMHSSLFTERGAKNAIGLIGNSKKDIIIVSTKDGGVTGFELQNLLEEYGTSYAIGLDGGGSTTLWADGTLKIARDSLVLDGQRAITDAIIFTRNKTSNVSGYSLRAKNTQFCIREHVVSGNILHTVTTGLSAEIVQFIPEFQTDGYQWARVKYQVGSNTIYGYSQLDTSSDYQVIKTNNNASTIYLKAITTSFRVRDHAVNGSTLEVVPVGQKARINALATGFASDGYQWANVTYNGVTGWSQLDLQGAYTIVEG
ncbi:MAG: phosphodiester glycosidase family protein [Erysipelotrichaceae bacterium]|nr:phosphodiester glycosidase family protein [Erysipelotrichaceae bacterium]